jgi:hypothetical protein
MEKPQIYTNEKNNKAAFFFAQQNNEREREGEKERVKIQCENYLQFLHLLF